MTKIDVTREMQAMDSRRAWGQILVLSAHGGRLYRGARVLVALKMANAVAIMERTMNEQAKLTPRRSIFANRTSTLILYFPLVAGRSGDDED
jgi:hypothetical protein